MTGCHVGRYMLVGSLKERARIMIHRCYILDDGFANTSDTLTLEQNSKEIGLLVNVFENEFAFYLICRTVRFASQCRDVTKQLGQSLIQDFYQQLVNPIVVSEKGNVSHLGALCDFLDRDRRIVPFQNQ